MAVVAHGKVQSTQVSAVVGSSQPWWTGKDLGRF